MGLIEEQQKMINIEYRKAQQEAEKATKEAEKLQKQLEKIKKQEQTQNDYEKDYQKAIEYDLIRAFNKVIDKYGIERAMIILNLKAVRDDILKQVPETDLEYNWASKNYFKVLKNVNEIYIRDYNAKKIIENYQEEKKEMLLEIICYVLLFPFKVIKYVLLFFLMLFFNIKT